MHPDLQLISRLWELDTEVDGARTRAAELKSVVTELGARIQVITDALEATAVALGTSVQREAGVQAELDKYIMRTRRTAKLLDGHQVVDFLTVEKQLAQCKEHVARIEGELLIEMETAEGLQAESKTLESQRDTALRDKEQAYADWVSEGRDLRAQIERVWPTRQAAAAELNRDLEKRYTGFRDRGLSPLAEMNDKFCGSCHVSIQDQLRLEVTRGRRIHNCRGCGRWLLPSADDQVAELAPNEAGQ